MRKHAGWVAPVAVVASLTAGATDMDCTVPTVATVRTVRSGVAEVRTADARGWTFEVSAADDAGRDVVTVSLHSPTSAVPPAFGVVLRVSGAGVQNVWTTDASVRGDGRHLWPQLWWRGGTARYSSSLARNAPIAVGFNSTGVSPVALACSEAFEPLQFGLYADDRTCEIVGRCEFFSAPAAPRTSYTAKVLLDRRGREWSGTVTACADWIVGANGFVPAPVPALARAPLYSTWYAYLQDVRADVLEKEARQAAAAGMKVMILDDGWQKVDSRTFYGACGDWMPVPSRFPDMKAHVAAVHAAGLKYMLWLGVPFMGDETKNFARFKDKLLSCHGGRGILDPRFPEVREYLVTTYERVVGEWDFDGVKLDFIDSFNSPEDDPALKGDLGGRDCLSVPEAVDRLMKEVLVRLRKIKPDVLIEFRQSYIGPAIRQYGNMLRATDCPADPVANRRRIADLRLTSGRTAVHSDMLVWSRDETPEGAALPILNALFGTVQYSMILDTVRPDHLAVIRRWIDFTDAHRATLLEGEFRPHHPELAYPWIEAASATERIIASYAAETVVRVADTSRRTILVNATGTESMLVELPAAPKDVKAFDVLGRSVSAPRAVAGLQHLAVPASGLVELVW